MLTCLPVIITLFTHIVDSSTMPNSNIQLHGQGEHPVVLCPFLTTLYSCYSYFSSCMYTTFMFLCRHISNTCIYIFPSVNISLQTQSNACTYIFPSINASSCLNRFLVLNTFHDDILSRHPEYP